MSDAPDTFNPAHLNRSDNLSSVVTVNKNPAPKSSKSTSNFQRLDFESLYTDLKTLIGPSWVIYHDALMRFLRGELSSAEFGDLTDTFLLASPAVEHAHNCLVCAILNNTTRDLPDIGPAAWVSAATDKAATVAASKPNVASDAAEQRLKTEVMALLPRDRRRLKTTAVDKAEEEAAARARNAYEEYYQAGKIRVPDSVPASAGGLTKTNWEPEIRKRYTQPLFSETLEFPDAANIFARMVPICYEESIASGSSMPCAELVSIAVESYIKDFLGTILNLSRSNGPKYENGAGNGIFTGKYKRQVEYEEESFKAGKIQRNKDSGLLPVEANETVNKRPISMADMRTAASVGKGLWNGMPLIGSRINEAFIEDELEEWRKDREAEQTWVTGANGAVENGDDAIDTDEDDYGWDGADHADRAALGSLLADCLAIKA